MDLIQLNSIDIKYCKYDGKNYRTEKVFDHHVLIWFISGESRIIQANQEFIFGVGDVFLIQRNELSYIYNYPKDGIPHKAIIMHLTIDRLKEFYEHQPSLSTKILDRKIIHFQKNPLLEACLNSMISYFELNEEYLPEDIAKLKILEAITILRKMDPSIDAVLANFDEPHKKDLATFMENNFRYNMSLEKFSYLSGRSLSSFKKDFHQLYDTTPQRWLLAKRLALAYHQIKEEKKKPSEVYYEAGFENLSHFSYVFKKQYGYAPSELSKV